MEIENGDCAWGCARGINTTWENLQIEKHKSGRVGSAHRTDLCFSIWRFSEVVFIPRAQPHALSLFSISNSFWYYRKRGSASYIVGEVHSVREREIQREREREKDGSDVTIVALKLAMSFALLLAKNVHLSIGEEFCAFTCQKICTPVSPLLNGAEFTLSVAKNVALFEQVAFFALSNGVIDSGSKHQSKRSNFRLHRSSLSSKKSKKWIKLIPKTIGNRKRDCAWGCAWGINTTWENLQIEKHKSGRRSFRSSNWFVLFDLQIFSGGVYSPSATSRTISFSISNSFWY